MLWLQVRDYIHVVDLADGHLVALQRLFKDDKIGKCFVDAYKFHLLRR